MKQALITGITGQDGAYLAELIKDISGYRGEIVFDTSKPDGTLRKLLDISRLRKLGWAAKISLREGLISTYKWFFEHYPLREENSSVMDDIVKRL